MHQTLGLLSRDLRQVVNRPVVDEFKQLAPALTGGELAREMLSLTRRLAQLDCRVAQHPQRVQWWLEEDTLWRAYFLVLDAPGTEAIETATNVTRFELRFCRTAPRE